MSHFIDTFRLAEYAFMVAHPLVYPYWLLGFSAAGTNPLAWQIWALLWRAAAAIAIWMGWRKLLPTNRIVTGLAAVLFAVYPIFDQQASALPFLFHWITLTLWGLSFYFMLFALEKPTTETCYLHFARFTMLRFASFPTRVLRGTRDIASIRNMVDDQGPT